MSTSSKLSSAVGVSGEKKSFPLGKIIANFSLIFIAVVVLVPALWMILAPSKNREQLTGLSPLAFGTWESYLTRWNNLMLYDNGVLLTFVKNSAIYNSAIVIISVATSLLAGFALAAINIRFKRFFLILVMIGMIIPGVALVMPLFVWLNTLNLIDSGLGLVLAMSLYPFGVFLSYIHFSTVVPRDLYDAAKVDGCGYFGIFWRIALPISKGLIGIIAFFSFLGSWTNFFLPQVLILSQEKFPLATGLALLFTSTPAFSGNSSAILPIERSEIALSALVMILPIMVLFIFSQRFLGRGMLSGAVKS